MDTKRNPEPTFSGQFRVLSVGELIVCVVKLAETEQADLYIT